MTPAPAATAPGTANITGMTAPATPGNYPLLLITYEGAGCAGNFIGLDALTVTVAEPTQAQSVPTLPLLGMIALVLGMLLIAARKLIR